MDADPDGNVRGRELLLDRDGRLDRRERAREHAHRPVAESLDDRAVVRVVVAFHRVDVPLPRFDPDVLVRLEQRGVPDHVGEHDGDKPAFESVPHEATL